LKDVFKSQAACDTVQVKRVRGSTQPTAVINLSSL